MKQGKILLVSAALTALFVLAMNAASRAEDVPIECPKGAPSCKIVIMTPQEIQTLEGAGLIFDSAVWANRANLSQAIDQWKAKIAGSANGHVTVDVNANPAAKKQDKLPGGKPETKK